MDSKLQLSLTTRLLHWVVALGFIALSAIGIYMANTESWALYDWHKSFGILLFGIILVRAGWRLRQGWPAPLHTQDKVSQLVARFVHWFLLLGTLAMPITGMLYSGGSGHGFSLFGWVIVPENPDAENPGNVIAYSETMGQFGETAHEILGYALVVAILLHIIGALKHHLLDKDRSLLRMLGK
jgi:cytochrome b561